MKQVLLRVLSFIILGVSLSGSTIAGEGAEFEVMAVSDLVRVFEDGYNAPPAADRLELFGVRNETISAQLVIHSFADLKNVSIEVNPIRHAGQSTEIPPDRIAWNFVNSIYIAKNTDKLRQSDLIRAAPARFPDYLSEQPSIDILKDTYKAVYLTIHLPAQLDEGLYQGSVTVASDRGNRVLPLQITIYPLTLPDERHLRVTEWHTTNKFKQFHGIDSSDSNDFFAMLAQYADNMVKHRQNVFRLSLNLVRSSRDTQGRLSFDFSAFDRWADIFWNTGKMDSLETGFVAGFGEGRWYSTEINLLDFSVHDETTGSSVSMPGKEFLPIFLPQLEIHLKEKGWLHKTVFHIADEPSNHNIMSWRAASDFIHRHAPSLRRMDAIETTHCQDRLEIWVPKLDILSTCFEAFQEAQRRGNELWFYTVGIYQGGSLPNKTVDVPLIESRILHWLNYRFGLTGYLHWGFNQWTDDPFESPGQHNGDGWHVYPVKTGLLDSLRWEQMRNGIQDYELLWLLEENYRQLIATFNDRLSVLVPSRRGKEISTLVVRAMHEYSKDPEILYKAKKQTIEELLELNRPPRLIVQTNPLEHTPVAGNCSIDLYGYTEPGTNITVNGTELPVADDGLFMENVRLTREHTIVVEAIHPNGQKKITRHFSKLFGEP